MRATSISLPVVTVRARGYHHARRACRRVEAYLARRYPRDRLPFLNNRVALALPSTLCDTCHRNNVLKPLLSLRTRRSSLARKLPSITPRRRCSPQPQRSRSPISPCLSCVLSTFSNRTSLHSMEKAWPCHRTLAPLIAATPLHADTRGFPRRRHAPGQPQLQNSPRRGGLQCTCPYAGTSVPQSPVLGLPSSRRRGVGGKVSPNCKSGRKRKCQVPKNPTFVPPEKPGRSGPNEHKSS